MIVVVIKVNQQENEIGLIAWPRSGYMDATLDKIVFASADHDFSPKNYPGYELFKEAAPEEGDNSRSLQKTSGLLQLTNSQVQESQELSLLQNW